MPPVQSKDATIDASSSSGSFLSALKACGLVLGGLGYAAAWYYCSITMSQNQCIACECPQVGGGHMYFCRGCRQTIRCCEECWPRYQREVHSRHCPSSSTEKFSTDWFSHLNALLVQPACQTCGGPAGMTCERCHKVHYCGLYGRECAMTDWPRHQKECKGGKPLVPLEPRHETKSILESPLPIDLIAHIESFLSLFQWGLSARVNHAWRNASLLPTGASHSTLSVAASCGYGSYKMSASARRTLRHLTHRNTGLTAADWKTTVQSEPLPHFSHLHTLHFYDESHPYHKEGRLGEYVVEMASTLRRLELAAISFGPPLTLGRLTQLRELTFGVVTVTEEMILALDQLTLLKSVFIQPKVVHVSPQSAAMEEGIEERRLFSALLVSLSRLSLLTHLRLATTIGYCHLHDDPLTAFFTEDAPVFEKVTHLMMLYSSAHLDRIGSLKALGKKFPQLKVFEHNQLADTVSVPDDILTQWVDSFELIFLSALNSVSTTLEEVTLLWPFTRLIRFRYSDKVAKRLKMVRVRSAGAEIVHTDPQLFSEWFVKQLTNLRRLELNLAAQHLFTEYVGDMMSPLIELPQLEYLALSNLGFPSADSMPLEVTLTPTFKAKRDAHRPLKYLELTPSIDTPAGDIYLAGQKLLTWLPRVEAMHHVGCELDLRSLLIIAQRQPLVWQAKLTPAGQDGYIRLTHVQTLPPSESGYFDRLGDAVISHELHAMVKSIASSDKSAISRILNLFVDDYVQAMKVDRDFASYYNTFSRSRCSRLEFSRVRIYTPALQNEPNGMTQILTDFVGLSKNRLYDTTHTIHRDAFRCQENEYRLLGERINSLPMSAFQSDWHGVDNHRA